MKNKKIKVCSLILMTAVCGTLSGVPHKTKAATIKNGIVYITKSDVKNGKVTIKDTTAKSIVVKSSVKKAIIQLNNVKLSDGINFGKGNFILKTKKTSVKNIKVSGKNTSIKLDKASDLNNKKLTLAVAKNATGNLDFASFGKNINLDLGKNTDFKLEIGKKDSVKVTIKKAYESSVLEIEGKDEGSKVSKITLESSATLVVNVKTALLETKKSAEKGSVTIFSKVDEIKNEGNLEIKNTFPLDDSDKIEDKKEVTTKDDKTEENNKKENASSASLGGGNTSSGGGAPSGSGSSGGSGNLGGGGSTGGGSSSPKKHATSIKFETTDFNLSNDSEIVTVKIKFLPEGSTGKIKWNITGEADNNKAYVAGIVSTSGKETIRSTESDKEIIQIKALNNGKYKISAKLGENNSTYIYKEGNVKGQKVKLTDETAKKYTAGDGKITGVEAGNQYILISGSKYYGVAADGRASVGFNTREEALKQVGKLKGTEITGLDNSKTYTVEKIDAAKEAEKRFITEYEDYMKDPEYEPQNITFKQYKKYKELADKGNKILEELEKKVNSADSDKAIWEERFNKALKRVTAVNNKIQDNIKIIDQAEQVIKREFVEIEKAGSSDISKRPDGRIAKDVIENIERELNNLEGIALNRFLQDYQVEVYDKVKKEVAEYNILKPDEGNLSFDDVDKVLTLPIQKIDVMYSIKRDKGNNEWEKEGEGVISAGKTRVDFKEKFKYFHIGKYVIEVFKKFEFLKNTPIGGNGYVSVNIN